MNNTLEQLQGKSSFPQNSFYYTCRKKTRWIWRRGSH